MNEALRAIPGGQDLSIKGPVLVAKSDRLTGFVCDIEKSELYFIQRLVLE